MADHTTFIVRFSIFKQQICLHKFTPFCFEVFHFLTIVANGLCMSSGDKIALFFG